ncbi:MAG: IPT/TIG domain-containing protein, partial [Planctomycetota bacterium]
MRSALALLLLLPLAACGDGGSIVVVVGLAQGGGGAGVSDRPELDIVMVMESDSTGFNPADLMRVVVNGVDRTGGVVLGGNFAVLRIDPAPPPLTPQFVELFRRTGPRLDSFTWTTTPYTGPTLASVSPASAPVGTQVTLTGAGFDAAPRRVFFGSREGTVDAFTPTSITATVPPDALPGLVYVLVGPDAAEGLVDFQPLDAAGVPVPFPAGPHIFA